MKAHTERRTLEQDAGDSGHTHWRCKRCGERYESPIAITAVCCRPCTNRPGKGRRDTWMQPEDSDE